MYLPPNHQTTNFAVPRELALEPVGPHFLAHARRKRHNRTFSEDEKHQAEVHALSLEDKSGNVSEDDEPEDPGMLARDPKEWKEQDHYAVLGLSKYRYKATDEQIKKAHRKKALKHHPDKKAGSTGDENDDSFFKCIQKGTSSFQYVRNRRLICTAYETLSDPVKRRQFDSVDEGADVEPPSRKAKGDFFKLWRPFFESEARFSNRRPVPMLGDIKSSKEQVEQFYNFWLTFDSWRSFEYLDKDPPDEGDNRDNKRWQEKKNKAERAKRKKEDIARLRKAVEDALSVDPRIKLFKDNERKEKERKKFEREAGARQAAEEARLKAEEEKRRKEEDEAKEKAAKEDSKKSKEAAKNRVKKEKRIVKGSVKEVNYFAVSGDASAGQIDNVLHDVELIMERLKGEKLSVIAGKLDGKKESGEVKKIFEEVLTAGDVKANELKFFGKEVNGE